MHVKYSAQWPSHISALYKLALDIIIHILCIPCSCWLSLRCWIKQTLSTIYTKLSRICSCESSYQKHFHYGFVSHLVSIFSNSPCVEYVYCDFDDKNKYNFFLFLESKILFRKLIKYGINVEWWFGNCKQRPSSKKILSKTWQKCQLSCFWTEWNLKNKKYMLIKYILYLYVCMYIYLQAGKQRFMKRKTENNSHPICVPRN